VWNCEIEGMHAGVCITKVTPREGRVGVELPDGGYACSSMHHWSDAKRGKGQCGIAGWRGCMLQHASPGMTP
jgi:hypothetical protein